MRDLVVMATSSKLLDVLIFLTSSFCTGFLDIMDGMDAGEGCGDTPEPGPSDLVWAVGELTASIRQWCDELATELLNRAALREGRPPPVGPELLDGQPRLLWELTKLRIRHQAKVDPLRAVGTARAAGATWQQIGAACDMTRQGAYDRWGKVVKQFLIEMDSEPPLLEKFDPGGQDRVDIGRRRRRTAREGRARDEALEPGSN